MAAIVGGRITSSHYEILWGRERGLPAGALYMSVKDIAPPWPVVRKRAEMRGETY